MSRTALSIRVGAAVALVGCALLPLPAKATPADFEAVWADADCRNGITPTDALIVLRADAGLPVNQGDPCSAMGESAEFDGIQRNWGDFDCNDVVSPVDGLKILQYDSGFEPAQWPGCPQFGDTLTVT